MGTLSSKEVENIYGLTRQQLDALEDDASKGILHGKPRGKVLVGRPLMFDEEMKQVGFKEPIKKIKAIDKRAHQLGLRRSEYLRRLVDEDLELAGIA